VLARASEMPANARERLHLAAISAVLADDYEHAKALLGEVLRQEPHDVLALQVAHALDYLTGDVARMGDRVASVLPAWSSDTPGYHAVLAMHAFGLEESGHYERAEEFAKEALALNRFDARAHHVLAHVFEMTGRAGAGVQWMHEHMEIGPPIPTWPRIAGGTWRFSTSRKARSSARCRFTTPVYVPIHRNTSPT
jgi:tetratricopeptide (TPR) repeat protein